MDTWLKTGIGGIIGMVGGAGLQYALTQPVYSCVPPDPSEYDEECNGTGICPMKLLMLIYKHLNR